MKIVLALIALLAPVAAHADMGRCANITSNELRRFCTAQREGNRGECASIRDNNLRRLCIARVTGNDAECASITDTESRNYCRGVVGR